MWGKEPKTGNSALYLVLLALYLMLQLLKTRKRKDWPPGDIESQEKDFVQWF